MKIPRKMSEPILDWFDFILKLAERCAKQHGTRKKTRWRKYQARHFWEVIVFGILNSLGTEDAAERWNDLKWEKLNQNKRRKRQPKKLGGKYERIERLAPDRSQVNAYKRQYPCAFINRLSSIVLREQLLLAHDLKLIKPTVDLFVDFTKEPYYGAMKYAENEYLHRESKLPGTKLARKFLGVMVKSSQIRMFSHMLPISRKVHRNDYVNLAIDELLKWGFRIKRLTGDREFVSRQLIDKCIEEDIHYFGPFAKTINVKKNMDQFLQSGGSGVYRYELKGKGYWYKKKPAKTWLILHSEGKGGLQQVKTGYDRGKLSLLEACENIYIFISTKPLPMANRRITRTKLAWVRWYKTRWWIETGYRDLHEFFPTMHARNDAAKWFAMMLRAWIYNAWQIDKSLANEKPRKRQFCHDIEKTSLYAWSFNTD